MSLVNNSYQFNQFEILLLKFKILVQKELQTQGYWASLEGKDFESIYTAIWNLNPLQSEVV